MPSGRLYRARPVRSKWRRATPDVHCSWGAPPAVHAATGRYTYPIPAKSPPRWGDRRVSRPSLITWRLYSIIMGGSLTDAFIPPVAISTYPCAGASFPRYRRFSYAWRIGAIGRCSAAAAFAIWAPVSSAPCQTQMAARDCAPESRSRIWRIGRADEATSRNSERERDSPML